MKITKLAHIRNLQIKKKVYLRKQVYLKLKNYKHK